MTERLYLTDVLFYFKNKLYYQEDENEDVIKLNNKNWHKYLDGYGWEKLPYGWKRRLKSSGGNFGRLIERCIQNAEEIQTPGNTVADDDDDDLDLDDL